MMKVQLSAGANIQTRFQMLHPFPGHSTKSETSNCPSIFVLVIRLIAKCKVGQTTIMGHIRNHLKELSLNIWATGSCNLGLLGPILGAARGILGIGRAILGLARGVVGGPATASVACGDHFFALSIRVGIAVGMGIKVIIKGSQGCTSLVLESL